MTELRPLPDRLLPFVREGEAQMVVDEKSRLVLMRRLYARTRTHRYRTDPVYAARLKAHSRLDYERHREKRDGSRRAWRLTPHGRMAHALSSQRRRASLRGVLIEDIDIRVLFQRDEGVCRICGLPVSLESKDRALKPSIDHVVPVVAGGSHSYENVALTHLLCNEIKADRQIPKSVRERLRVRILNRQEQTV